jgi:hypothetical protein
MTLFYLSGTINSLLLVIARPQLLLLTRPKPERPLARSTGTTAVSDKERSPEAVVMMSVDVGSSNITALKRVNSEVSV